MLYLFDKQFFVYSLLTAIVAVLISGNLEVGIAVIIIAFLIIGAPSGLYIPLALFALLTLVVNLGEVVRVGVQISSIGIMILGFTKKYGFNPGSYKKVPSFILYFFIFLVFTLFITAIFSNYPSASITLILRTLIFFSIVYMIYSLIQEDRDIYTLIVILAISSLVFTISVIVDFMSSGAELMNLVTKSFTRSSGLMSNINAIGGIIANLVPIAFVFLFYSGSKKKLRPVSICVFILLMAGIFFASSRAAYVSIFVSIILILYMLKRSIMKWTFAGLFLVMLLFLFYPPLNDFIMVLFRIEGGLAGREDFWDLALNIIKANPWLGIGPGAYKYEVYNYLPVLLESSNGYNIKSLMELVDGTNSSHNMYLVFFSDMGLPGLLTTLFVPIIFFKTIFPLLKFYKRVDELKYIITLGIFAMGTGAFVRCMFMEMGVLNYGYITTDLPFWVFFGILIHLYQKDIKMVRPQINQMNTNEVL